MGKDVRIGSARIARIPIGPRLDLVDAQPLEVARELRARAGHAADVIVGRPAKPAAAWRDTCQVRWRPRHGGEREGRPSRGLRQLLVLTPRRRRARFLGRHGALAAPQRGQVRRQHLPRATCRRVRLLPGVTLGGAHFPHLPQVPGPVRRVGGGRRPSIPPSRRSCGRGLYHLRLRPLAFDVQGGGAYRGRGQHGAPE